MLLATNNPNGIGVKKMSMFIVFQQMLVIFIMMAVGYYMYQSGKLSEHTSADLSRLITTICNPALLICSAFDRSNPATGRDLLITAGVAVIYFIILVILGVVLPRILRVKRMGFKFYHMMSVYGNIGFIGIPLISAVLGSSALIYLSVFVLVFNILVYTHGVQVMAMGLEDEKPGFRWKRMINPGTVAGAISIVLFISKVSVPLVITDSLDYMGRCTTFLSMIVLGISLARMPLKELFGDVKMYLFAAIRFLALPVLVAILLKPVMENRTLLGVIVLTLALPVANMPLMLAKQFKMDTSTLARGIVLTTLLSLITVTIASGVLFG